MRSLPLLFALACSGAAAAVHAAVLDYTRAPFLYPSASSNGPSKADVAVAAISPVNAVNCSSTIALASLGANGTFLIIRGVASDTNADCLASAHTALPPNAIFHVYTKSVASLRDADNTIHRGKLCNIVAPAFRLPIRSGEKIDISIPLNNLTTIDCSYPIATTTAAITAAAAATSSTTIVVTSTTKPLNPTPTPDDDDDSSSNNAADSGARADWITGQVTFFTPNQGACGDWNDDNDFIAALGPSLYGNMNSVSKYCNKKILITGPKGNSITVTVKDACPGCARGHLDLSPAAFAKLGAFDTGILKVKWHFV